MGSCLSPRRGRIVPSTREIDDHTLCVYIIYASSKRKSKESLKASSSPCIYLSTEGIKSWSWACPQVLEQGGRSTEDDTRAPLLDANDSQLPRSRIIETISSPFIRSKDKIHCVVCYRSGSCAWMSSIDSQSSDNEPNLIVGIAATQPTMQRPRRFNRR